MIVQHVSTYLSLWNFWYLLATQEEILIAFSSLPIFGRAVDTIELDAHNESCRCLAQYTCTYYSRAAANKAICNPKNTSTMLPCCVPGAADLVFVVVGIRGSVSNEVPCISVLWWLCCADASLVSSSGWDMLLMCKVKKKKGKRKKKCLHAKKYAMTSCFCLMSTEKVSFFVYTLGSLIRLVGISN